MVSGAENYYERRDHAAWQHTCSLRCHKHERPCRRNPSGGYVKRGNVPERPTRKVKNGLHMDRLSSHRFLANSHKLLTHLLGAMTDDTGRFFRHHDSISERFELQKHYQPGEPGTTSGRYAEGPRGKNIMCTHRLSPGCNTSSAISRPPDSATPVLWRFCARRMIRSVFDFQQRNN